MIIALYEDMKSDGKRGWRPTYGSFVVLYGPTASGFWVKCW